MDDDDDDDPLSGESEEEDEDEDDEADDPNSPWRQEYNDIDCQKDSDRIVPRDAWVADDAEGRERLVLPVSNIFCGFTETDVCTDSHTCVVSLQRIQKYFMEVMNMDDIPYNFIFCAYGIAYQGRGWEAQPALPLKYSSFNDKSLYFAFIGKKEEGAAPDLLRRMDEVISYGIEQNFITQKILRHVI